MASGQPRPGFDIPTAPNGNPVPEAGPLERGPDPDRMAYAGETALRPSDFDLVTDSIEGFMHELYDSDRHMIHNRALLGYYDKYSHGKDWVQGNPTSGKIDRTAFVQHDFVAHTILEPEKTAERLGRSVDEIKSTALATFNELYYEVEDKEGLIQALLLAIDAAEWESAARRVWRNGATNRITGLVESGVLSERKGQVLMAAVNKTPELEKIDRTELEQVLKQKESRLLNLTLEAISQSTIKHDIGGLPIKGIETLDLIEHPPQDNLASTYRDCIEALTFFVPTLKSLGYKELANDLRGAALKWLVDDPNGHAEHQHDISVEYFGAIEAPVMQLLDSDFRGDGVETDARIKTEGSLREKLSTEDYQESRFTPDGVGFVFIVDDTMAGGEMTHFARSYMRKLTANNAGIDSKHPLEEEEAFEDLQGENRRASGYEAIHMTFYYYPSDDPVDYVPFEIQVMTKSQYWKKLYGPSSDLFYKAGVKSTEEQQQYLEQLARRAQAQREKVPGATVQSVATMLERAPELHTVFHDLFRSVRLPDTDTHVLVPHELESTVNDLFASPVAAELNYGELIILPPTKVSEAQFLEAISLFDRSMTTDPNVLNALKLAREQGSKHVRGDGVTSVLEGHLLPTALAAAMFANQSGTIWHDEAVGPSKMLSNIITITILHDYVEALLEPYEHAGEAVILQKRQEFLFDIKDMFDPTIMEGVDAMTLHMEIDDNHERHEAYTVQTDNDINAQPIKPVDRWHNHGTDLVKLATGQVTPGSKLEAKIMAYFAKTDRHLSRAIEKAVKAGELPPLYARTHNLIWALAKQFGYSPDNPDES
jgi:hypothetical protein